MYKKISFLIVAMIVFSTKFVSAQSTDNTFQSVVQVMSYDAIYGRYPVLRGRWSASIISSDGLILTNNHVVSQENGMPMSTFAVCISKSISSRPDCTYTASLVKKDSQKDIALLRIDSTDIYGQKTDYSRFTPLVLDLWYKPVAQDKTLAIGYPSVGADTITQTIGVVAGTQQYNDVIYIKTDAAIAPGSSGGPLLKDGKIIWINTFAMGENSALWYSLLISQVSSFVDENKNGSGVVSTLSTRDFQLYLQSYDTINKNKKVSDSVFTFGFNKSYVISDYIPNTQIAGRIQNPDDTNIQSFSIALKQVAPIKSYNDFVFLLKKDYGYDASYYKLIKENIAWLTMYSMVYNGDLSQWDSNSKFYIAQYDTNTIVQIALEMPSMSDTTKQDIIKKNINSFLAGLNFSTWYTAPSVSIINMYNPVLALTKTKNMYANIVDIANNIPMWRRSSITPFATVWLSNPHESITYSIIENTVDQWSTKSIEDTFTTITEWISSRNKWLISYMGNPWYMFCTDATTDNIEYPERVWTRQWAIAEMGLCRIALYLWQDQHHILFADLNVEKSKMKILQKKLLTTFKKDLRIAPVGDGMTNLPTSIMKEKSSLFTDTSDQTDPFNDYLALLVSYNILPKTTIAWLETPMTYRYYVSLYLKAVYNIVDDKTDVILWVAGINPDLYVDSTNESLLNTLIQLRLAWVVLPNYSHKTLQKFQLLAQSTYRSDWKKIEEFEYTIYKGTKFTIDKVLPDIRNATYMIYNAWVYDPIWWLKKRIIYNDKWPMSTPSFGTLSNLQQQDRLTECAKKSIIDKQCMSFYKNLANTILPNSGLWYEVVTRGDLLDSLKYSIDIGLFDFQWKAKKE